MYKRIKKLSFTVILFVALFFGDTYSQKISLDFEDANKSDCNFLFHPKLKKKKIGLVLSGGGARGLAHIGVLNVLEREHIPIDYIAGTSMGSVVGGLYASGMKAQDIKRLAKSIRWHEIFKNKPQRQSLFQTQKKENSNYLVELKLKNGRPVIPSGFSGGQRLINILTDYTLNSDLNSDGNFDKLKIPFRAIATDIVSGNRVVISSGMLAEAMRASFAVPVAFTPIKKDSMLLLDGGIVDNLPVDIVKDMGADFVIAVDVKAPLKPMNKLENPVEILDQIITLAILNQNEQCSDSTCYKIVPQLGNYLSIDFTKIDDLIRKGEDATIESLPILLEKIKQISNSGDDTLLGVVNNVKIEGMKFVSPKAIDTLINIAHGDSINTIKVKETLRLLYGSGFFKNVSANVTGCEESLDVVIKLEEYPVWKKIVVKGTIAKKIGNVEKFFNVKEGRVINWNDVEEGKKRLLSKYHKMGYTLAQIKKIEKEKDKYVVYVDDGIVDKINIVGLKKTQKNVVLRECVIKKGKIFNVRDAKLTIKRLYSTNLFDNVTLKVSSGVCVTVVVKEKEYNRVQFGMRYDEVRFSEGFLRYVADNLWGTGSRWINYFQYGLRREKFSSFIVSDRLGSSYFFRKMGMYLYKDKKHIKKDKSNEYTLSTLRKVGGAVSIGRQLQRLGQVSVTLRTENFPSDTVNKEWFKTNLGDYTEGIRSITIKSEVDDLNKISFPTSGRKHSFSIDLASDMIGGTEKFIKYFASVGEYYTFQGEHTFYPRLQLGYANRTLPAIEKHSIGGYSNNIIADDYVSFFHDFSFMGYKEHAFSGDCIALLNLRYRWNVLPWMYAVLQYDIGETWEKEDFVATFNFIKREIKNLKQGVGLGLAFDTPVGPVALVYAQALNAKTVEEKKQMEKVYFSVGYDF